MMHKWAYSHGRVDLAAMWIANPMKVALHEADVGRRTTTRTRSSRTLLGRRRSRGPATRPAGIVAHRQGDVLRRRG